MGLFLGFTIGPIIGTLVSMATNYFYTITLDRDNEFIGILLFVLSGVVSCNAVLGICYAVFG